MSWEITYRDKWSGKTVVHKHTHNEGNARGWAESLTRENNCKAICEKVSNGQRTHIITTGHDK